MSSRHRKSHHGRVERVLRNKAPKLVENTKRLLGLKGLKCSAEIASVVKELVALKKPHAVMLPRLNPVLPFEDQSSLEFLAEKNDASLMLVGSHSKKRPHNLVMARFFDFKVLDMIELGVTGFTSAASLKPTKRKSVGSVPCFLFSGDWEADPRLAVLKNLFLDMFHGMVVTEVALPGLDHVIAVTCSGDKVFMRTYSIHFKRSGTKVPRVELESCGPNVNFELRRSHLAAPELAAAALRTPKILEKTKTKNVTYDGIGTKEGHVHMERQNYDKLQTRKVKALTVLRKRKKLEAARGGAGGDEDADNAEGEDAEEPTPRAGGRNKLKKSRAITSDE